MVYTPARGPITSFPSRFPASVMTIDFLCKKCRSPMQTPESAAGKKGRCQECETVMIIPLPAPDSGAWHDFDESGIFLVKRTTTATMKEGKEAVRFSCLRCAKGLWLPSDKTHKKVECSGCGIVMRLSNLAAAGTSSTVADGNNEDIRFQCPQCQHTVTVAGQLANQQGKCPKCKAVVEIPEYSKLVRASDPAPMTVDPLGLDNLGSMDLEYEDPLLAGSWDASLGTMGSGTPSNWDGTTSGMASDWNSTGAGISGGSPFGQQYGRTGMPWENDSQAGSGFWATARGVLFSPSRLFQQMKLEGGVGKPLQFSVAGMMLGGAALILYGAVFLFAIALYTAQSGNLETGKQVSYGGVFARIGIGSGAVLLATSLGTVLLVYLLAAVHHLALTLTQSTNNHSLETTVRVISYAIGSIGVTLIALPLFPLALLVSLPISLKKGSEAAHGASSGQATIALLITGSVTAVFVTVVLVLANVVSG